MVRGLLGEIFLVAHIQVYFKDFTVLSGQNMGLIKTMGLTKRHSKEFFKNKNPTIKPVKVKPKNI